ncbi:MAG: EndoU domain-containing protein [Aeromonas sp.]
MTGAALAYLPIPASPRPAESRPRTRQARHNPFSRYPRLHPKPRQGVKNRALRYAPGLTLKTHANPPGITPIAEEAVVGCSVAAESIGGPSNLASPGRTNHILFGDATGGGHKFGISRFFNGKSKFPATWSNEKIMTSVSDIATDPSLTWKQLTGVKGTSFTKAGKPARFSVEGVRHGATIRVIVEPAGDGIITGFKIK